MSKRPRWAIVLSLVMALLVIAGAAAVLRSPGAPDNVAPAIARIFGRDNEAADETEATADDSGPDSGGALTNTDAASSGRSNRAARNVTDTPAPPAEGPSAEEQWQAYLAETKAVVEGNEPGLAAAIEEITQALSSGDEGALAGLLAGDEGSQSGYIESLAETYPPILESTPAGTVNIFTTGDATVYFAYSIVTWTDAGITSEHTIPIMLRFVNGEWRITTLGDTGSDLEFVQSVQL